MRERFRAQLEQPLFDQHRHLAGERKRLLPLGKDPDIPVVSFLGRGQLGARLLVARRLLLQLPDRSPLPLDFRRARLLPLLEAFDAAHHDGAVAVDGAEQAGEQQLERVVALVLRLGGGELRDGCGRLLERHAAAGEDRDELCHLFVVAPLREIVDRRAVPHLRRGQRRDLALHARPVRTGCARAANARGAPNAMLAAIITTIGLDGAMSSSSAWLRRAGRAAPSRDYRRRSPPPEREP